MSRPSTRTHRQTPRVGDSGFMFSAKEFAMFAIRSLITLIVVPVLVAAGCNGNKDGTKASGKGSETQKQEVKPAEPKGPGGEEMK
jgi:hypothetical protein